MIISVSACGVRVCTSACDEHMYIMCISTIMRRQERERVRERGREREREGGRDRERKKERGRE